MPELAKSTEAENDQNQKFPPPKATVQPHTPDAEPEDSPQALPPATPQAAAMPAGRVLQLTGAYIEPITRFSQADLQETAPEQQSHLVAIMTSTQRVSIKADVRDYAGGISGGTIKVPTLPDVSVSTERLREAALAEVPTRTSTWAALDNDEYRRLLPSHPFLSGFKESYGYEYSCNSCSGNGKVKCNICDGHRRKSCDMCDGTGRERCPSCNGDGRKRCNTCKGQGSGLRWEYVTEWDSTKSMNVSVQKQVYHSCNCTMGYDNCNICRTAGKVECSKCRGSKSIPCDRCNRTGKTNCGDCAATGRRHKMGYLGCQVSTDETLELHHPEATAVAQIKPRLTIPELTKHARLTSVRHQADGARVISVYQTDMLVTKASLSAAGLEFSIFGFGPEAEIFDYQNIAGKLLEADVEALDAAIAGSSAWRIRGGDAVLKAASVFVESELNLLIAESVTQAPSGAAALIPASVESKFKGLVDESYITRASTVFNRALGRIYQPQMAEPGLYCTGIAVLSTAASYGFSWPNRAVALPLGLTIGAVSWIGVEFATRWRIRKHFPGTSGARMLAQIDATGLPARLRGIALGAAVAGSFVAMWCINSLPHERLRQAEEISTKHLKATLKDWHSSSQADLRLRTYPALATLRKSAAAGNADAGVVLGWQLVLGAGGVPKDVPEATHLFNSAAEKIPRDALVQTGQVVALLNSDAKPQALRDGLATLRQSEAGGLVEARYWRARLQLAEQSPVYDLRAGVKAMNEAADLGHASAAFEMSKRFASGNGVRIDKTRAAAYLHRAEAAGLPEAKAQLAR